MGQGKTISDIYEQWQRVFQAFMRRGKRLAAKADPMTGGNEMLVRNWGNEAAKAAWVRTWAREHAANGVYKRLFDAAEHRTHGVGYGVHFRPAWCEACNLARKVA